MRKLQATLLVMLAMTSPALAASLDDVNADTFQDRVINTSLDHPVAVFFWASDVCAPCRKMLPDVEAAADLFDGKIEIVKLDIEDSEQLAIDLRIFQVPIVAVYERGTLKGDALIGSTTADKLNDWLGQYAQ
jgi:thioredoxin 1